MAFTTGFPSYLIGTATVSGALVSFASPRRAYELFGLPFERSNTSPSPYLFAMAVRQLALGLSLMVFEATDSPNGVETIAAAVCLVGAVDGWIVWVYGGELRDKAWNHWVGTIVTGTWYSLRFCMFS